jgi:hypothetical protein
MANKPGQKIYDYKKKTARSQRALVPPSPLSARGRERFLFIVGPDAICPHVVSAPLIAPGGALADDDF